MNPVIGLQALIPVTGIIHILSITGMIPGVLWMQAI